MLLEAIDVQISLRIPVSSKPLNLAITGDTMKHPDAKKRHVTYTTMYQICQWISFALFEKGRLDNPCVNIIITTTLIPKFFDLVL
jgi:hypothetical protein